MAPNQISWCGLLPCWHDFTTDEKDSKSLAWRSVLQPCQSGYKMIPIIPIEISTRVSQQVGKAGNNNIHSLSSRNFMCFETSGFRTELQFVSPQPILFHLLGLFSSKHSCARLFFTFPWNVYPRIWWTTKFRLVWNSEAVNARYNVVNVRLHNCWECKVSGPLACLISDASRWLTQQSTQAMSWPAKVSGEVGDNERRDFHSLKWCIHK